MKVRNKEKQMMSVFATGSIQTFKLSGPLYRVLHKYNTTSLLEISNDRTLIKICAPKDTLISIEYFISA